MYDILSRVPVPAHAAGEPSELFRPSPPSGYPVLNHDSITGDLTQVRWNNDDRSVMSSLDPYMVEEWYISIVTSQTKPYINLCHRYNAIRTWHQLITSSDSEYWVQLNPSTAVGKFQNPFTRSSCADVIKQSSTTTVCSTGDPHLTVSGACVGLISAWTSTARNWRS